MTPDGTPAQSATIVENHSDGYKKNQAIKLNKALQTRKSNPLEKCLPIKPNINVNMAAAKDKKVNFRSVM